MMVEVDIESIVDTIQIRQAVWHETLPQRPIFGITGVEPRRLAPRFLGYVFGKRRSIRKLGREPCYFWILRFEIGELCLELSPSCGQLFALISFSECWRP